MEMKNIHPIESNADFFTYFHIFTQNYFSDTIIANGIPCEGHSKITYTNIKNIDTSGKLLNEIFDRINQKPNGQRKWLALKSYSKILNKYKRKRNKKITKSR
jgi:hypothetical protein